jgi:hypothetical protein
METQSHNPFSLRETRERASQRTTTPCPYAKIILVMEVR